MSRIRAISAKTILVCGLTLFGSIASAQAGSFTTLYAFQGVKGSDGGDPTAGLIADSTGNLYGTTQFGGIVCEGVRAGCGTVFKVARNGTETLLHAFKGRDGEAPVAGLIADSTGNLYGTTEAGGTGPCGSCGTVFKLAPDGTETVLYSFRGGADGQAPAGGLIADTAGNFYGTTALGGNSAGDCGSFGCGTVFKLAPDGTKSVLYAFCPKGGNCNDGGVPDAGLIADGAGNFYGTTYLGGANGGGAVFKLAPDGTETVFYSFCASQKNCTDGLTPLAGLLADKAGNLYGTTGLGGSKNNNCNFGPFGCGTVFKLAPDGTETVLYSFCKLSNCSDGNEPYAAVAADEAGNFYGTTQLGGDHTLTNFCRGGCGAVFKLAPDGTERVLHHFHKGSSGAFPLGGLLLKGRRLFGTASSSGTGGYGTVFELDK